MNAFKNLKVKFSDTLKEYHKILKKQGVQISYDELELICTSPFKYIKKLWSEGKPEPLRIKHFGMFYPHKRTCVAKVKEIQNKEPKFGLNEFEKESIEILNKFITEIDNGKGHKSGNR